VHTGRGRAVTVIAVSVAALSAAGACSGARDEPPGKRVAAFYAAMAEGRLGAARDALLPGPALHGLERRFGSFSAWAGRATKNRIVMRTEVLREDVAADRARVEVVALFNDGTRRHDVVELVRSGAAWKIDPRSLPGASRSPRAAATRNSSASRRDLAAGTGAEP
jgi:hypothetical protein